MNDEIIFRMVGQERTGTSLTSCVMVSYFDRRFLHEFNEVGFAPVEFDLVKNDKKSFFYFKQF